MPAGGRSAVLRGRYGRSDLRCLGTEIHCPVVLSVADVFLRNERRRLVAAHVFLKLKQIRKLVLDRRTETGILRVVRKKGLLGGLSRLRLEQNNLL